jgi:arylsulfatase A-like enzyme
MHVSLLSPHHPVDPPPEYFEPYTDEPVPRHRFSPDEKKLKPGEQTEQMWCWDRAGEEHRQRMWRSYYGLVTLVDDQVGRLIEKLGEVGRLDDAFIVFTTDHGEMLFDHGLFDKAFAFYDQIIHVPAIVRWPKHLPAGATVDGIVESTDLVATTLAAAGVEVPHAMTSRDLSPLMRGEADSVRDYAVTQHFNIRCIRTHDMKLVFYGGRDYGELYDLRSDPDEMDNRWSDPACAGAKADLIGKLADWAVWSTDPRFRQVPVPTNKGAYSGYLERSPDTKAHYLD